MCYLTSQTALELWNDIRLIDCNTFLFDCPHIFDIVLFKFILLLIKLGRILFLDMLSPFARSQGKTLFVKFRLLPRKTSMSGISLTFFIIDNVSNIYCGNLSKVVGLPTLPNRLS